MFRTLALGALALTVLSAAVLGAPPAGSPPTPLTTDPAATPGVLDVVVLVDGPAAYLEQIGRWTPARRFPVLIDDGTHTAAQDIARFVRAFKPAKVARARAAAPGANLSDPAGLEEAIRGAVRRSWGAPDERAMAETWRATTTLPAGLVVFDPRDGAWTAAAALAAGRGQLLLRVDKPADWPGVDGTISLAQAQTLLEQTGAVFRAWMPDKARAATMRAVTLCGNTPVRVQLAGGERLASLGSMVCKPGESIALSDLLGRFAQAGSARWGVAGQIFGTPARSAYIAMSSLFLTPRSALVFDGYNPGAGFDDYDGTRAARALRDAGLTVELHDRPDNRPADWRKAMAKGLSADLVMINSHGMRDVFNLADAPLPVGDVPALDHPSAVWMVHSWSAVTPGNRWTIAGRWLERGAYAYVGSVHEPYLQAFVPTPALAEGLMKGVALGSAVRRDAPPWRVAMIGDPLTELKPGPGLPRRDAGDLEGLSSVEAAMREDLKAKRFGPGIRGLALLGRDKDAARVAAAVLRDAKDQATPALAAEAIASAFRAGDLDTFFALLAILAPTLDVQGGDPAGPIEVIDLAWNAAAQLGAALSDERVDLMGKLVRPGGGGQTTQDAGMLAAVVRARHGEDAARTFIDRLAARAPAPGMDEQIRRALPR